MTGLLSDVRVLDLTHMLAGPYGTALLADMGADMIKIENHFGDHTRGGTHMQLGGMGAYFLAVNRNKRSVVLDLKSEKGREVFYDLVKISDVVVDNMRPLSLQKLKCDYDDLKKINPRIISCSLTGFGHTGPHRDRTAFDLSIQAISGGMGLTGEPGRPPVRAGIPIGDLAGGMAAALSISAALHFRDTTGKGQKLDISLLDVQISMLSYVASYYLVGGILQGPQGSRHGMIVPYEAFQTKDSWIVVACVTQKFWEGLCIGLGVEELIIDERFNSPGGRLKNHDDLIPILQNVFLKKTSAEWLQILDELEVPCAPVNSVDRALSDPQVLSRNMVVEFERDVVGKFKLVGNPIKTSATEEVFNPPPFLGEHTESILKELLGYSDEKIKQLNEEKAIGLMGQIPEEEEEEG